jgi:hypothetical protein
MAINSHTDIQSQKSSQQTDNQILTSSMSKAQIKEFVRYNSFAKIWEEIAKIHEENVIKRNMYKMKYNSNPIADAKAIGLLH